MRVLVTGGSGFVGSHAVAALVAEGHECRVLARSPDKACRVLAALGVPAVRQAAGKGAAVWPGDVRDARAVRRALAGCDAVLHAAADMGVTGKEADLRGANVTGLCNVLGQAVELGLQPVVHVSTVAVFVPSPDPVITAGSPLAEPRGAYGRSKVEGERYARRLDGVTIVYPGGVAGPGQPRLDALNEGIRAGVRHGWPMVPGGVCVLDVRDLAAALARCVTTDQTGNRYLLGGHFLTWPDIAALCDDLTGRRARRYRLPGALLKSAGTALDALRRLGNGRLGGVDYPLTRDAADMMLAMVPTDDRPALTRLGLSLRPVKDTISDTLCWLAAEGHLNRQEIGRLCP
ncbi:NAD-dependent epimerase/dehydratase family protein [Thermoactinospora rubra]|uniref:NAD-dependent epimerase/dehydratase family protein n=1 Tax=Thermoactinospora rubra TaxID=1088767 RepID=UPI000A109207|nr:NAD-dependent epimerase/dehydratase family protein [Thermoactinospora rubra]